MQNCRDWCAERSKTGTCGMKCVNLNNDVIKILAICYSYNKQLENEKNFLNHIIKLQNVLKMWRMRSLYFAFV